MKYDISLNNIHVAEIEGISIEDAMDDAGLRADFTERSRDCGYLHVEPASLIAWLDVYDPAKDTEELEAEVMSDEIIDITYGPAE